MKEKTKKRLCAVCAATLAISSSLTVIPFTDPVPCSEPVLNDATFGDAVSCGVAENKILLFDTSTPNVSVSSASGAIISSASGATTQF